MASSTTGDMKGYFRQRKKSDGITKPSKAKSSSASKKSSFRKPSASCGSDLAIIPHGSLDLQDDYDAKEEVLRQFDMNMAYGPCLGMSRMARWERANTLGLNPPKEVESILSTGGKVRSECVWDGRI